MTTRRRDGTLVGHPDVTHASHMTCDDAKKLMRAGAISDEDYQKFLVLKDPADIGRAVLRRNRVKMAR